LFVNFNFFQTTKIDDTVVVIPGRDDNGVVVATKAEPLTSTGAGLLPAVSFN
jgi:hypothetical protein